MLPSVELPLFSCARDCILVARCLPPCMGPGVASRVNAAQATPGSIQGGMNLLVGFKLRATSSMFDLSWCS